MEDVVLLSSDEEVNDNTLENNVTVTELEHREQRKEMQIRKLVDALQRLQALIQKSEETEVDFEDEDKSSYMLTESYKQRAIEIYEKICELKGERKGKTIKFKGTDYDEFNRVLQRFVNDKNGLPDFCDVKEVLDGCNKEFNYQLSATRRHDIALNAFAQIGNLLQKRRKRELHEMLTYYSSNNTDPAREDSTLKSKLDDNRRQYGSRLDTVIDEFCRRQYSDADNKCEGNAKKDPSRLQDSEAPTTSLNSFSEMPQQQANSDVYNEANVLSICHQQQPMDIESEIDDDDDDVIILEEKGAETNY